MKLFKFFLVIFVLSIASMAGAACVPPEAVTEEIEWVGAAPMAAEGHEGPHKFMFISADVELGGMVVRGAPYSAEAVTERTQTLADGNRIVNKSSARVFRDSEGRTRREQQITAIGNWEATEEPPHVIFIQDPVAKMHYVLEPENKSVRKIKVDEDVMKQEGPAKIRKKFDHKIAGPHHGMGPGAFGGEVVRYRFDDKDAKKESLGKQTIEGVVAEGTRTTITIAAGEMGNESPIQIVSEQWYSPELQVNLMTRHHDPRFGETVYQLTQISRGEQDRSLFEVPADYKVDDSPMKHKIIKREVTKP